MIAQPFQNETESATFAGFTVENRVDRVSLYGSLDLTRDRAGLAMARRLQELLAKVIAVLEADGHLPDKIEQAASKMVLNPLD